MMRGTLTLIAATTLSSLSFTAPAMAIPLDPQQRAVWQGELDYWKYVNTNDRARYLELWASEFRGWPCGFEHPADFNGLAAMATDWFAETAANKKVTTPTPEAVVVGRGYAITYLSAETRWTDKDGKPQTSLSKLVHTWKPTKAGWKIVGGMCGDLERQPAK